MNSQTYRQTTQEQQLHFLMGKLQNERPNTKLLDAKIQVKQRNDKGQGNCQNVQSRSKK